MSTEEDRKDASAGEGFEFDQRHPKFVAQAEQEGNPLDAQSLRRACNLLHAGSRIVAL